MITIELSDKIKYDTSIRDYKLFDGAKLVARWTRAPSPSDIASAHQWYGEWVPATQEDLDEYNKKYLKPKIRAKYGINPAEAAETAEAVKSELDKAVELLKMKYENEI